MARTKASAKRMSELRRRESEVCSGGCADKLRASDFMLNSNNQEIAELREKLSSSEEKVRALERVIKEQSIMLKARDSQYLDMRKEIEELKRRAKEKEKAAEDEFYGALPALPSGSPLPPTPMASDMISPCSPGNMEVAIAGEEAEVVEDDTRRHKFERGPEGVEPVIVGMRLRQNRGFKIRVKWGSDPTELEYHAVDFAREYEEETRKWLHEQVKRKSRLIISMKKQRKMSGILLSLID